MSAIGALRARAHDVRMLGPGALGAFVVSWGALVTWLSAQPSRHGDPTGLAFHLLFNIGHAPLFGFWAGGVAFALAARIPRPLPDLGCALAAVAATVAFGALDEWHQSFVPGRTSSWTDVVTDAIGAWVTVLCLRYIASPRATLAGLLLRAAAGIAVVFVAGAYATERDSAA